MAIEKTMNSNYVKPADAKSARKSTYESGKIGTTSRGTAIVDKNSGLGKDAFLNLLVAQLKNMDPTQNQDSTAYVTQMAQFASIEQTNNLNTTMRDFANEQMVGKVVLLNEKDVDGYYKYGIVSQIIKNGSITTATVLDAKTGEYKDYSMNQIIGTSDSGYGSANYETALNSNFSSASSLANDKALGVYVEIKTDKKDQVVNGQNTTVITTTKKAYKCRIEKAYLDKKNSTVNVTIQYLDEEGKEVGEPKTVDFSTIAVAGKDLSEDVIKEAIKNNTLDEPITSRSNTNTNNNNQIDNNNNTDTNQANTANNGNSST